MTEQSNLAVAEENQPNNSFFINAGTNTGWFMTVDGDAYNISQFEPREVTDPRTGEVSMIWGGYATARDRDLAARDAMLATEFRRTGARPSELFEPQARDIPLYITLRHRPGKGFTDIGSFWNSKGRYTVLARDMQGKNRLRFAGNVLAWKSKEALAAEKATAGDGQGSEPDPERARASASKRARKSRETVPVPSQA